MLATVVVLEFLEINRPTLGLIVTSLYTLAYMWLCSGYYYCLKLDLTTDERLCTLLNIEIEGMFALVQLSLSFLTIDFDNVTCRSVVVFVD